MKITVIGGGVAGYPAAITATKMGAEVTLIECAVIGFQIMILARIEGGIRVRRTYEYVVEDSDR